MRPATAAARKILRTQTPQVASRGTDAAVLRRRSEPYRQRALKFLNVLKQIVIGEILALTLSKSHLE